MGLNGKTRVSDLNARPNPLRQYGNSCVVCMVIASFSVRYCLLKLCWYYLSHDNLEGALVFECTF